MKARHLFVSLCILILGSALFAQPAQETNPNELTVYAPSSFCGDWGPGQKIVKDYGEKTGVAINLVDCGSEIEALARVDAEKNNPVADILLSIPDNHTARLIDEDLFIPVESDALNEISPYFLVKDNLLVPQDYGDFAFVYDTEKIAKEDAPRSLEDLTDPKYKDQFILINPTTSSVGEGLLLWSIALFGDEYLNWWKAAGENALTIADGWSSAYGLFTEGEAPMVLSYTTSPVYHVMWEETTRYQTLIFDEGHKTTVEYMGILKSSPKKELARDFINYMLTEAQTDLAQANSMYPANNATVLPEAYQWAPKPEKELTLDAAYVAENLEGWKNAWEQAMIL